MIIERINARMHKNRGFAHVQFLRKFPVADGFETF
jgi:hypothetical protein